MKIIEIRLELQIPLKFGHEILKHRHESVMTRFKEQSSFFL